MPPAGLFNLPAGRPIPNAKPEQAAFLGGLLFSREPKRMQWIHQHCSVDIWLYTCSGSLLSMAWIAPIGL